MTQDEIIAYATKIIESKGIKVKRPFVGVWFCNGFQYSLPEFTRLAAMLEG